jgi:hypothetical protein
VTNITWAMTGTCGFVHKLCGVVFNSDKMVGGEFAKGLASSRTWSRVAVAIRVPRAA